MNTKNQSLNKLNELLEFCKDRKFQYMFNFNPTYFDEIPYYKKGQKIKIKKENKGKFTDYCGGKVTSECIAKGKRSPSPAIRKRSIFAQNSRKWHKKQDGGILWKLINKNFNY